jgi:prephenate dehydrogenase
VDSGSGITIWGVMLAGFTACTAAIGHLYTRLSAMSELAHNRAAMGDDKLWNAMDSRHKENIKALEALRVEAKDAHGRLADKIDDMREGIDQDRRAAFQNLVRELHSMKGMQQ